MLSQNNISNYILHAINYIIAYLFQLSQGNSEKYLNITHC